MLGWYCPAGQPVQAVWPVLGLLVPAGQAVHVPGVESVVVLEQGPEHERQTPISVFLPQE